MTGPHIQLPPSHRIRLLYAHLTDPSSAGGLGISPGSSQWKGVVGIYPLHDPEFDRTWVRSFTKGSPTSNQLDSVRENVRLLSIPQNEFVTLIGRVSDCSISTERKSDCISPSLPHIRNL